MEVSGSERAEAQRDADQATPQASMHLIGRKYTIPAILFP